MASIDAKTEGKHDHCIIRAAHGPAWLLWLPAVSSVLIPVFPHCLLSCRRPQGRLLCICFIWTVHGTGAFTSIAALSRALPAHAAWLTNGSCQHSSSWSRVAHKCFAVSLSCSQPYSSTSNNGSSTQQLHATQCADTMLLTLVLLLSFILQRSVEMEGKNFIKLCKDTKLMSKSLTSTDIDLIFTKVRTAVSSVLASRRKIAGRQQ